VKKVGGTVRITPEAHSAEILWVNASKLKYRPGETLKAYVNYRPFRGEEAILPVGADVRLMLTSEIVLAQGVVGDTIEAKLNSDIKAGKDVLAPKGAIARGRIVKLERQPEFFVLALHFSDLEWRGGHARLNLRFESMTGIEATTSPNLRPEILRGPEAGEIVILRSGPKRLKDVLTRWRVVP